MSHRRHAFRSTLLATAMALSLPAFADEPRVAVTTTKHAYVYYRDHDIYYSPETQTWYWRANGQWRSGMALPAETQPLVKAGGLRIELDTRVPYERHDYVVTHYKSSDDPAMRKERTVTTTTDPNGDETRRSVTTTTDATGSETTTTTTTTTRHRYVYYGDHDIYYSPQTKTWFWRDGTRWQSGPVLPVASQPFVKVDGIQIELETERPYEQHAYVIATYKNRKSDDDRRH